jgi:hypothetical protein
VHTVLSAPIVGITSLDKRKELIGEDAFASSLMLLAKVAERAEHRCSRNQTLRSQVSRGTSQAHGHNQPFLMVMRMQN